MDELGDIDARSQANAANLRRAFGAPVGGEPPAFAALLQRLAAKAGSGAEARSVLHPGAIAQAGSRRADWSRTFADA